MFRFVRCRSLFQVCGKQNSKRLLTITASGIRLPFSLDDTFLSEYKSKKPPFGFNGLGELVYLRTYSRLMYNGEKEQWWQTVQRVVEGTFSLQKQHIEEQGLVWDEARAQQDACEMYKLIFDMKFLPPGRGLWAMGTDIIHRKNLSAALNNCAFVSTEQCVSYPRKPFTFLMDASMLGVGVGFDTKGAGKVRIIGPSEEIHLFHIPDTREGWVESVGVLLDAYLGINGKAQSDVHFDYSSIRPEGTPLKTFGGVSSGPGPLQELHTSIRALLDAKRGLVMDSTTIVDLFNLIGRCVISGNVRRSAEIAFGEADDAAFLELKNYEKNPYRASFGWCSNNSVFASLGMDYHAIAKSLQRNGEPGIAWLENMQKYGRFADPPNWKDYRVRGGNPCLEQSLESYELCCLVETFPVKHTCREDFFHTLRYAMLYAKTVTLCTTHWPETNQVLLRNRRIGCSVSGIADFLSMHSLEELRQWLDEGYSVVRESDKKLSEWLCIPTSVKLTCVKPSGTVSLLAGTTPGMHYPESRTYLRRIRLAKNDPLVASLQDAGFDVEPALGNEKNTMVVSIPVRLRDGVRCQKEVSMSEQFALAAFLQRYWADNQVSCTISFDPVLEGPLIADLLQYYQYQLKGVSLLPKADYSQFPQMPYEAISEEEYERRAKQLKGICFPVKMEEAVIENAHSEFPNAVSFCSNDTCELH